MKVLTFLFLVLVTGVGCKGVGTAGTRGDGTNVTTFTRPDGLQIAQQSDVGTTSMLIFGLFNKDAYVDIMILTETGNTFLYLSNGGASWYPRQTVSFGTMGNAIGTVSDLNFDSNTLTDLIIHNNITGNLQIYSTSSSNTTSASFTLTSSTSGMSDATAVAYAPKRIISTGDNNKKGFAFVVGSVGTSFFVPQEDLNWGSKTNIGGITGAANLKVDAADMNGDSYVDFVVAQPSQSLKTLIFSNTNDTTISNAPFEISRTKTEDIKDSMLVNLSGDTLADIVMLTTGGVELWTNKSTTSSFNFEQNAAYLSTVSGQKFWVGDVTDDGAPDILITKTGGKSVLLTQSAPGTLSFSDITATAFGDLQTITTAKRIYGVDINGDGYLDVVELGGSGAVAIYINNLN